MMSPPLRAMFASRSGLAITAVTIALGVLAATGAAAAGTFTEIQQAVQLAMSATLPFLGVLAVGDLHRTDGIAPLHLRLGPRVFAAVLVAITLSLLGSVIAGVTTRLASGGAGDPWAPACGLVVGAAAVQVIAQLTGTGFGLLLRRAWVAMAATMVVPLGLYGLLSPDRSGSARSWLTPYGDAQVVLGGQAGPAVVLAHIAVAVLIWGVGLNAAGARWQRTSTEQLRPSRS